MIIVFELILFLVKVIFWKESAIREDLIMDSYHFEKDFNFDELQEIGTGFQGTLIFFFHCL